jgi:hypothetical protein
MPALAMYLAPCVMASTKSNAPPCPLLISLQPLAAQPSQGILSRRPRGLQSVVTSLASSAHTTTTRPATRSQQIQ